MSNENQIVYFINKTTTNNYVVGLNVMDAAVAQGSLELVLKHFYIQIEEFNHDSTRLKLYGRPSKRLCPIIQFNLTLNNWINI